MSSEIMPFSGTGRASREARSTGKAILRSRGRAELRVAEADHSTDVALAKVDNITMATGSAMQAVVKVARAQRELEQLAPEASHRLAYLADTHLLGCSELLDDLRREMRRNR